MIIETSSLILRDIVVLQQRLEFIPPENEVELEELFPKYSVNIDFGLQSHKDKTNNLFFKTEVNKEGLGGYKLFLEIVAIV